MMDDILSGLGAAFGFAALHFINDSNLLQDYLGVTSCLCPPLGAVAVLLFCMPNVPASQPKSVIGGHVIAGLVSYGIIESNTTFYPELLAVSITITLMSLFKVVHPPAGAYAFFFTNKRFGIKGIIAPGLIGAIILIIAQQIFFTITKQIKGNGGGKKKKA